MTTHLLIPFLFLACASYGVTTAREIEMDRGKACGLLKTEESKERCMETIVSVVLTEDISQLRSKRDVGCTFSSHSWTIVVNGNQCKEKLIEDRCSGCCDNTLAAINVFGPIKACLPVNPVMETQSIYCPHIGTTFYFDGKRFENCACQSCS